MYKTFYDFDGVILDSMKTELGFPGNFLRHSLKIKLSYYLNIIALMVVYLVMLKSGIF